MAKNDVGDKVPLNPLYVSMPFIFKRTGEIRRLPNAQRFSKALSRASSATTVLCAGAASLTVSDHQTTYILSKEQTAKVMSDADNVAAMVINGWSVERTSPANECFVRDLFTQEGF